MARDPQNWLLRFTCHDGHEFEREVHGTIDNALDLAKKIIPNWNILHKPHEQIRRYIVLSPDPFP